jgi:chloramphenicol O-acetyltransferase
MIGRGLYIPYFMICRKVIKTSKLYFYKVFLYAVVRCCMHRLHDSLREDHDRPSLFSNHSHTCSSTSESVLSILMQKVSSM